MPHFSLIKGGKSPVMTSSGRVHPSLSTKISDYKQIPNRPWPGGNWMDINMPPEIVRRGKAAMFHYFIAFQKERQDHFYLTVFPSLIPQENE